MKTENDRLAELISYKVLDTDIDQNLDDITKAIALNCECEIALISLIDEHRQWFKSKYGLDICETKRDISFCDHAIKGNELFIVKDAAQDARFLDNPLVIGEPRIRFYAGYPLISPNGYSLGTLCIISSKPKNLNDAQKLLLKTMANQVVSYFDLYKSKEEAELGRSRSNLLMEKMLNGVAIQNDKGQVVYANEAALKITGLSEGQFLGKTAMDPAWRTIREDGSPLPGEEHPGMRALSGETVHGAISGFDSPKEGLRWVKTNAFTIESEKGLEAVSSFLDITDLVEGNNQVHSYLKAIDAHALVSRTDRLGNITYANNNFCNVSEYSIDELIGSNHRILNSGFHDQAFFKDMWNKIIHGEIWQGEILNKSKSGKEYWVNSTIFALKNQYGEIYEYIAIRYDVTEQKQLEKELIEQREMSIHQSKLASIGELAAGVGHEINNPLALLKGYLNLTRNLLFKDRELEKVNSEYENLEKYLSLMEVSSNRIESITKGLRSFSRMEQDETEQIDLKDVLEESYGLLNEIYYNKGISIDLKLLDAEDIYIEGSRGKFQQVIMNLIANARDALEHKKGEKRISIQLSSSANKKDDISIHVKDNGQGIPEEFIDKVSSPFFTTKEVGRGTGIGLSFCFDVINKMKGSIHINSKLGVGSEFVIKLPKASDIQIKSESESLERKDNSTSNDSRLNGVKVLLVDDEEGIREILTLILEDLGLNVSAVSDGQNALEAYKNSPDNFDIIISDMQMPNLDGPSLLKSIRSDTSLKQPKFIFSTGGMNLDLGSEDSEFYGLLDGYISKPFSEDELLETLLSCIETN